MEAENQLIELKTPSQVLKLLKEDLKNSERFNKLLDKGFINKDRLFKKAYQLIQDNFKQTKKSFILEEQIDILIKAEVDLSLSEAMESLLNIGLLEISGVNKSGDLTYKLSNIGAKVADYLKQSYGEED